MKKGELKKCEGLMYDAIIKANNFKKNYAAYERLLKDGGENVDAECKLRLADQEIGYTEGIYQALAVLGFKHDDMKTLGDLL